MLQNFFWGTRQLAHTNPGERYVVSSLSSTLGQVGKEVLSRYPFSCTHKKYQEANAREGRNEPWPCALVQLISLWRLLPLPLSLLASTEWGVRELLGFVLLCFVFYNTSPVNSFPGLRNQLGHQGPSGVFSKSLNRGCRSPGLRVEEGVHAKILCFWIRRFEVEGWVRYFYVQVWSSHSAFLGALQVWTSTVFLHSLHRTAQHQWNLHSHWVTRVTRVVSYPRPQHMISQPSVPLDVLLQTRPAVPREPGLGKREWEPSYLFLQLLWVPLPTSSWGNHKESCFLKIYPLAKMTISLPSAPGLFPPTIKAPQRPLTFPAMHSLPIHISIFPSRLSLKMS